MAIIYIDPTVTGPGTGSVSDPYKSYTSFTPTAGNTYRQKRGTTYTIPVPATTSAFLLDGQTATAANPTIIEAYYNSDGSDDTSQPKPIINCNTGGNGQGGIRIRNSNYVIIRNFHCTNQQSAGGGISVHRGSTNVSIENCLVTNSTIGIFINQDVNAGTISDVSTYQNEISGCGGGILHKYNDFAGTYIRNIIHEENYLHDNTMDTAATQATSIGGITHWFSVSGSATLLDSDRGFRNWKILNNEITRGRGYGISVHGVRDGGLISGNHVHHNNLDGIEDTHGISAQACSGIIVEKNIVHDNVGRRNHTAGSQVGIFMDWYLDNSSLVGIGNIVRGNYIYNGWRGPTAVTQAAAAGIYLLNQQNTIVEDNIIINCPTGITSGRDSPVTPANIIRNNTILNTIAFDRYTGVGILIDTGNGHQIYNNIIQNCSKIGLFVNSALTGISEHNNLIYQTPNPYIVSASFLTLTPGTLDASDLQVDAQLDVSNRLKSTSPAIGYGSHTVYHRDATGIYHQNPPSLGAYEYIEPRGTRT